jgi:short-subunit dehydrogenase
VVTILVVGASSAIAKCVIRELCSKDVSFIFAGRDIPVLNDMTKDSVLRGAIDAIAVHFDASDSDSVSSLIPTVISRVQKIDICLIAHGILPDQTKCNEDSDYLQTQYQVNFLSVIGICNDIAGHFEDNQQGCLAVISSVAGDFGKQSNYAYGSAKAALNIYLQGLRSRLYKHNVRVITIKPGFVDTPMTQNFKKGFVWAQPQAISQQIVKILKRGNGEYYLPTYWRVVMFLFKHIPEPIRSKLSL